MTMSTSSNHGGRSLVVPMMLVSLLFSIHAAFASSPLTPEELENRIAKLRGEDSRLIRWDATEHTVQQQALLCDEIPQAAALLSSSHQHDEQEMALAASYLTLCLTDHPRNRAALAAVDEPQFYLSVVQLVSSADPHVSVAGSHLIYAATFGNRKHHGGFYHADAVPALARILKTTTTVVPVQSMWAAAALQNMAATYCLHGHSAAVEALERDFNPRCEWTWVDHRETVVLTQDSMPLLSNGMAVRQQASQDGELLEALVSFVCQGPVEGTEAPPPDSEEPPWPGETAVLGRHEGAPSIVPWAAAGALKNLLLDPHVAATIEEQGLALPCLCRMAHSSDWLEEDKGASAIFHLRRGDPCWFDNQEGHDDYRKTSRLCLDHIFSDADGYTCADYEEATWDECNEPNEDDVTPKQACCACGGGTQVPGETKDEIEQEL